MKYFILVLLSVFMNVAFAGSNFLDKHYKSLSTDGKQVYDLVITSNTMGWRGIEGSEKGLAETNPSHYTSISDGIDVIQWQGKMGSFNTLVINNKNLKYVYSAIDKNKVTTLEEGKLEVVS